MDKSLAAQYSDSWVFRYRWLVLACFPILTFFFPTDLRYFVGLSFSGIAAFVLLLSMKRVRNERIPIYMVFGLFIIAYFIRMAVLQTNVDIFSSFVPASTIQMMMSNGVGEEVFEVTVFGFVVFCLVSSIYLSFAAPRYRIVYSYQIAPNHAPRLLALAKRVFIVTAFMAVVISFVFYKTGVGVLGSTSNAHLPFHLGGLVVYAEKLAIPYGFLIVIMIADALQRTWLMVTATVFLLLHAFIAGILSASRGEVIIAGLYLIVVWLMTNRLSVKRWQALLVLFAAATLLTPLTTRLRYARAAGYSLRASIDIALNDSWKRTSNSSPYAFLYARISGVEQLYTIVPAAGDPNLSVERVKKYLLSGRTFAMIYTEDIENENGQAANRTACTGLGLFYFVGGYLGIVLGWILWIGALFVGWRLVVRYVRVTTPVALAMLSVIFFSATMEGTLDNISLYAALVGSIWLWETIARSLLPQPQVVITGQIQSRTMPAEAAVKKALEE
ncbi:MAG: hypothetical protein ACREJ2_15880 [Planctomycetota bacterium]